jgi:S-adenosylmethionine/arginine decarboxylase-like enzyme
MLEHKHLIIRAEVKKPPVNEILACEWIQELTEHINMKILIGPFAKYLDVEGNRGLTVAAIIETSHIVMHCWDESEPAIMQLDIYSCGPLEPDKVFEKIQQFEPIKVEYKFLDRETELKFIT